MKIKRNETGNTLIGALKIIAMNNPKSQDFVNSKKALRGLNLDDCMYPGENKDDVVYDSLYDVIKKITRGYLSRAAMGATAEKTLREIEAVETPKATEKAQVSADVIAAVQLKGAKSWVNPGTGATRYYIPTNGYLKKAGAFWCENVEKAPYSWPVKQGGFFHADKVYNGCVLDDIRKMFSGLEIIG